MLEHNYAAVFQVGRDVLRALSDHPSLAAALTLVDSAATEITKKRVFGRHDLIGRVYHTLLADKKFLATYFTSVPAATLLCQLALTPELWPDIDWGREPNAGPPLQVGDLACGTGTLLVAALGAVRESWAAERASALAASVGARDQGRGSGGAPRSTRV